MSSSSSFFSGSNPTPTEYQTAVNLVAQATQQANTALAAQTAAAASAQSAQGYSVSAGDSATTATNQASSAATSATASSSSATNASTSATNAATSATAASNSATSAATSATNSANSATAAATSATNAATSATNAANSATAAATSATNAATTLASALTKSDNLASLTNVATARSNLGLSTLATTTPGTGVATALGVNVGSAGAFVTNGGALGTPSSGNLANCTFPTLNQNTTGTASNITGTVAVANGGTGLTSLTAGYIPYGNGTGAYSSSSAFTYDGRLAVGAAVNTTTAGILQLTSLNKTIDSNGLLQIFTSDTAAANLGGSIGLGGKNGSAGQYDPWTFAHLRGSKENGTSGDLSGYFAVGTSNSGGTITERLRITSAGNVGIGTSSPGAKLDVSGTFRVSGQSYFPAGQWVSFGANLTLYSDASFGLLIQSPATSDFIQFRNSSGANLARIDASGNLGIGTTAPSSYLTRCAAVAPGDYGASFVAVSNNSVNNWARIDLRNVNQATTTYWHKDQAGVMGLVNEGAHAMYFGTNNLERMRIDASGNVGIGIASSISHKLNVAGNFAVSTYINNPYAFWMGFQKTRSTTPGTYSILSNGDHLGFLRFTGDDGTQFADAAWVTAYVDGTPAANSMPGRLVFLTTPSGSVSPVERMRITASGDVLLARTTADRPGLSVGATGATRQVLGGMTGSSWRIREWDNVDMAAWVTNITDLNAIDKNTIASWKTQQGGGQDYWRVARAAAGSTTFSELLRITAGGWVQISNSTAPSSNPTSSGYLYVENGALKYRGSSGTVTTIAAA